MMVYIYTFAIWVHIHWILWFTHFEVPDWRAELEAREQCLLQFMRIAEEVGVGFAFPTTTVEVEQPEGKGFSLLK